MSVTLTFTPQPTMDVREIGALRRAKGLSQVRLAALAECRPEDINRLEAFFREGALADRVVEAGGRSVPLVFRTGAAATLDRILGQIRTFQAAIRAS